MTKPPSFFIHFPDDLISFLFPNLSYPEKTKFKFKSHIKIETFERLVLNIKHHSQFVKQKASNDVNYGLAGHCKDFCCCNWN
ncbi:CLUMA_CG006022, isoform A [Clunio marinus]|uniref:CLUMA_CG006022, isoform A n=1 Tax=Clunio marinus TaxID=568069 RepID=A0A1J1HYQ4_9DIPT|nr:CLUMA_CG006022, isoform A [Clunio marinus]